MNLHATQPIESPPAGAGVRFAYASGDRPLEGYTIKRGIGRGGFGEVYYAISDGGKEVALKLVCRNLEVELRGVTQCLNIKHPNLLSLYDIRQDDHDESWVVMEYVAGDSLERILQRHPDGMPIDDVMFWMQGIAAGVGYLHHHGIIHRDLKPGNIFCDEGVVKVGDYGLSKFISCSRRSGQTGSVGTVHYMAPEVANGRYGKEIDIYALGIMLYEMITGRVPFEGESLGEVLMKHLTAQPDLASIAEPYRTAIARALAKDPDARPHTVSELMSLLPRSLHATLASLGPVPLPPPFARDQVQRDSAQREQVQSPQPAAVNGHAAATAALEPPVAEAIDRPGVPGPGPMLAAFPSARPARVEEPLGRLVRDAWAELRGWWANLPAWARLMILLAVLLFVGQKVLDTEMSWVPAIIFGYVAYRIFWRLMHPRSASARRAERAAAARAAGNPFDAVSGGMPNAYQPQSARYESPTWRRWREAAAPPASPPVSRRQRLADLIGSMLLAAVVVLVVSLLAVLYRISEHEGSPVELNQYAWLALSAIAGAWSIIIPARLWEVRPADPTLRRFVMLAIGLGVGFVAYALQTGLLVQLPYDGHIVQPFRHFRHLQSFYGADGAPSVFASMAYFGLLWLVLRWWLQASSWRSKRLSLWSVMVSLFWAAAVNCILPFPQPWGLMFAATVSIAVQLASPSKPKKGAGIGYAPRLGGQS
jgi:hypothetical protein